MLVRWALDEKGAASPFTPSDSVEITERASGKDRYIFVLNHSAESQKLALPAKPGFRDILTGQKMPRQLTLKAYDVRILSPIPAS